jgi:hypothetical protein
MGGIYPEARMGISVNSCTQTRSINKIVLVGYGLLAKKIQKWSLDPG